MMFQGRGQLQRRDREVGLTFNWRIPVSSSGTWAVSVLLVGLISAVLATTVRVKIGGDPHREREHGTLVLVPGDQGGDALVRSAIEAGPFPARWNPAADPAYVALRRDALRLATMGGLPYRPEIVAGEMASDGLGLSSQDFAGGVFPALPDVRDSGATAEVLEVMLGVRVLDAGPGVSFGHAALPLPAESAGELVGRRFLVAYDEAGRVVDVVALSSRARRAALVKWLSRGLVRGHSGKAGWISVETMVTR